MDEKQEPPLVPGDDIERWMECVTGDAPLSMAPAEFAARHAHGFGCFGLHRRYRYASEKFDRWIKEFGSILESVERLEECRLRYLTPEELADVMQHERDGF